MVTFSRVINSDIFRWLNHLELLDRYYLQGKNSRVITSKDDVILLNSGFFNSRFPWLLTRLAFEINKRSYEHEIFVQIGKTVECWKIY